MAPTSTSALSARLRTVICALALVAGLGACSAGGDDEKTDTTTTAAAPDASTTEAEDEPTTTEAEEEDPTTTEASDPGGDPDLEVLRSLLPAASDIGEGFRELPPKEDDGSDPEFDAAMESACPEMAEFVSAEDDDEVVKQEYEDEQGRSFQIVLDPTPRNLEADQLTTLLEALNSCSTVEYEDEDGVSYAIDLEGDQLDTLGDRGAVIGMSLSMEHPALPQPVQMTSYLYVYLMEGISVQVMSFDGLSDDASEVFPVEPQELGFVAGLVANAIDAEYGG